VEGAVRVTKGKEDGVGEVTESRVFYTPGGGMEPEPEPETGYKAGYEVWSVFSFGSYCIKLHTTLTFEAPDWCLSLAQVF